MQILYYSFSTNINRFNLEGNEIFIEVKTTKNGHSLPTITPTSASETQPTTQQRCTLTVAQEVKNGSICKVQ